MTQPSLPVISLPDEHGDHYLVDGRPVRRISTVLRQAGLVNLDGIPHAVLENARARGSQVDDACSLIMEGRYDERAICAAMVTDIAKAGWEEARPYVEAYREFWPHCVINERLSVQVPLYCAKLDFCCTPDWFDRDTVNDIKTGSKPQRSWGLQIAAQELAHGKAMVGRILWLRPKLKRKQLEVHSRHDGNPAIFSRLDYAVIEAACDGNYDADCIQRWKAGE